MRYSSVSETAAGGSKGNAVGKLDGLGLICLGIPPWSAWIHAATCYCCFQDVSATHSSPRGPRNIPRSLREWSKSRPARHTHSEEVACAKLQTWSLREFGGRARPPSPRQRQRVRGREKDSCRCSVRGVARAAVRSFGRNCIQISESGKKRPAGSDTCPPTHTRDAFRGLARPLPVVGGPGGDGEVQIGCQESGGARHPGG